MQFLYPGFLWALAALAIPIIIHLFAFRRFKKVLFTNVRFLQEIKEETSNRSKLKNLLVLLSRMAALAALVFAFAQPFIPRSEEVKSGNNIVAIFVDNSHSMQAAREDVPLLALAKNAARQIVNAYSEADQFQVLTHDFEGRHQRLVSKEEALTLIEEIEISPKVKRFDQIYGRIAQTTALSSENRILYVLSDFQQSILPATTVEAQSIVQDTSLEINFLPIQSVIEANISIDSAWLDSPVPVLNQTNKLLVRIRNHGSESLDNVRLSYTMDGQTKPEGTFTLPSGGSITDTIQFTLNKPGANALSLQIADYPIQFDDILNIALDVPSEVKVLSLENKSNRYLNALFAGLPGYSLTTSSPTQVKYSDFASYSLIILNEIVDYSSGLIAELRDYINDGGNIMFIPPSNSNITIQNTLLSAMGSNTLQKWESNSIKEVSSINIEDFVFKDVYLTTRSNIKLPTTKGHYNLTNFQGRGEQQLLTYRDGSTYLGKYGIGKGQLYLCAAPLDIEYNDLSTNAEIFVPMMYKTAISKRDADPLYYTIGSGANIIVEKPKGSNELLYKIEGNEYSFVPGQINIGNRLVLDVQDQIRNAGVSNLTLGESLIKKLAFNYDRLESDTRRAGGEELKALFGGEVEVLDYSTNLDITQLVDEKDRGIQLWRWFLIAALLFLLLEILLLRLFKMK